MKKKVFYIDEELYGWATRYVRKEDIRGSQGNVSVSELIRILLRKEREEVKKSDGED